MIDLLTDAKIAIQINIVQRKQGHHILLFFFLFKYLTSTIGQTESIQDWSVQRLQIVQTSNFQTIQVLQTLTSAAFKLFKHFTTHIPTYLSNWGNLTENIFNGSKSTGERHFASLINPKPPVQRSNCFWSGSNSATSAHTHSIVNLSKHTTLK